MLPDTFDILAIIFGIFFTVRKLDAQHRSNKEFPHVAAKDFNEWQQSEVFVYQTAIFACFGKVAADFAFGYFYVRHLTIDPYLDPMARTVGMTLDLSWMAVLIFTFVRIRGLARRRRELRIVLGGLRVETEAELSTEMKGALRRMEDGDFRRAAYEFKQISLDSDESMKALALYWLGQCHLRQAEPEAAAEAFRRSLEADPQLVQPREALDKLAPAGSPEAEIGGSNQVPPASEDGQKD